MKNLYIFFNCHFVLFQSERYALCFFFILKFDLKNNYIKKTLKHKVLNFNYFYKIMLLCF